ncbi:MAG TPA: ABC transporter ATP-binding protein [Candidatus Limivivens intestinipullorum]|uniref:ABC transporter ATP-binding protein n=1 Tax=Candidatus Limivivens intestinipullorum TaxID=2840858 RepID=A0A9D1EUF6_9FIRM|nr:ABC transporter ATP-binding protein [Candidatus Limivivens intestinipullorum]
MKICNLTKQYGGKAGITGISFALKSGEAAAVIGPNGAGKTTLSRAVCGLSRITEGSVLLDSVPTFRCRERIGYMQDNLDFYEKMTVYETLDFLCAVKFHGEYTGEISPYLKKYHLYDHRNQKISRLSLGMKRKMSLIMALLGTPRLLILDEPTNGIDTADIIRLKQDLLAFRENGGIVLVTSHVLDWAEKTCTRFLFLKSGRIAGDYEAVSLHTDLETLYERLYLTGEAPA